jgi:hypothetical protein
MGGAALQAVSSRMPSMTGACVERTAIATLAGAADRGCADAPVAVTSSTPPQASARAVCRNSGCRCGVAMFTSAAKGGSALDGNASF